MIIATGMNVTTEGEYVVLEFQGEGGPYRIGVLPAAALSLQVALARNAHGVAH